MPTPNDDENISSPSDEDKVDTGVTEEGEKPEEETPGKKSAEARINELVGKVKELEETIGETKEEKVPMPPTDLKITPEVQRAIDHLKNIGFVTKDEMKAELDAVRDRTSLESDHARLANTYSGSDGKPKYDKRDVEKYMRDNAVYNPEVAYDALHKIELLDWELKQAESKKKERPYVEKGGQSAAERGDNTITREKIADAMKTPEGRIWYEKNRPKILSLMQQGQL